MKKIICLCAAVMLLFTIAAPALASGDGMISPCYLTDTYAVTTASVSGSGLLSVSIRFTGTKGIVTGGRIVTEVEKRGLLGLFWSDETSWTDSSYTYTGTFSHTYSLPEKGTYRVTSEYAIYSTLGTDYIPSSVTVTY